MSVVGQLDKAHAAQETLCCVPYQVGGQSPRLREVAHGDTHILHACRMLRDMDDVVAEAATRSRNRTGHCKLTD